LIQKRDEKFRFIVTIYAYNKIKKQKK